MDVIIPLTCVSLNPNASGDFDARHLFQKPIKECLIAFR